MKYINKRIFISKTLDKGFSESSKVDDQGIQILSSYIFVIKVEDEFGGYLDFLYKLGTLIKTLVITKNLSFLCNFKRNSL